MKRLVSRSAPQGGFMLLEALIAVLIFSMGILALVGLQATATRYSTDAKFRSTAGYLASQRMGEIWVADRATILTAFEETGADLSALLPNGQRTVHVAGDTLSGYTATVTINWQLPGDSVTHQYETVTIIHDRCDTTGCA
jgi:type IV pilus assembly protein PilV